MTEDHTGLLMAMRFRKKHVMQEHDNTARYCTKHTIKQLYCNTKVYRASRRLQALGIHFTKKQYLSREPSLSLTDC